MGRRNKEKPERVKAVRFILSVPCSGWMDDDWARGQAEVLRAVFQWNAIVEWMWEPDVGVGTISRNALHSKEG